MAPGQANIQGGKMRRAHYPRKLAVVLALLIMASLIPLSSCGGAKGTNKGSEQDKRPLRQALPPNMRNFFLDGVEE
jgi:hypothetical protein